MSSSTLPHVEVTCLSEFVEQVKRIRSEFVDQEKWKLQPHQELWFRGEENEFKYPLCPTIYRPKNNDPRKSIDELLDLEFDLFEEFWRRGLPLSNWHSNLTDQHWDWYYLMQHYGAPTRLLDWTD